MKVRLRRERQTLVLVLEPESELERDLLFEAFTSKTSDVKVVVSWNGATQNLEIISMIESDGRGARWN